MRQAAAIGYIAAVAVCAVLGAWRENPAFYLAAIILALPSGLIAFVGIYLGYALLSGVGSLFTETSLPDGSTPSWLLISSATWNVLLIVGAALANLLLLRWWRRRRVPNTSRV